MGRKRSGSSSIRSTVSASQIKSNVGHNVISQPQASASVSRSTPEIHQDVNPHPRRPGMTMIFDSFKRETRPNQKLKPNHGQTKDITTGSVSSDRFVRQVSHQFEVDEAELPLARRLKGRHLQMIAIGGSIGTGLFVGSGTSLAQGGPGALLISFAVVGVMIYCTVQALGEMAVLFPVAGSFSVYASRFVDPAWGFAMGWNYALQWLVVLPLEIVAAAVTIEFWTEGKTNPAIWVGLFLILIIGLNLIGIKGYGEAEFGFSLIKIIAIIGFIIVGLVINLGGGPVKTGVIGFRYWSDPGAFHNGFKGVCSVFVVAAFAFAGTELVGLAAAETANPAKSLPRAVKQIFWRVFGFYILSVIIIGLVVPFDDVRLLGRDQAGGSVDWTVSPFVIALQRAGMNGLPSVMNGVILIAVLSVANSSVYGSSRTLAALADQGQAPAIFGYVDRNGRPLVGIAIAGLFGLLAFLSAGKVQAEVLKWLLAASGLSAVFTWASICIAHIRFRHGWKRQGRLESDLPFVSPAGLIGSWLGAGLNILVLVVQLWVAISPIPSSPSTPSTAADRAYDFFSLYLAMPVTAVFYIVYKLYFNTTVVRAHNMDLHTGIRELDTLALAQHVQTARTQWPWWKHVWRWLC